MKKLIILLLLAALIVGIVACNRKSVDIPAESPDATEPTDEIVSIAPTPAPAPASPSATVAELLDSVKEFDHSEMQKHITAPGPSGALLADYFVQFGDKDIDIIRGITGSVNYRILNETIDGDTATVQAEIVAPDFSTTLTTLAAQAAKYAASQAILNRPIEMEKFIGDFLREKVDFSNMDTKTTEAAIYLEKSGGDWLVINDSNKNRSLLNALTGGVLDQIMSLVELAGQFK